MDRQIIADDYHKSEAYSMSEHGIADHTRRLYYLDYKEWCPAPRELILSVLDHIDSKFGGIRPYLTSIGFNEKYQHKLVNALTGECFTLPNRPRNFIVSKL